MKDRPKLDADVSPYSLHTAAVDALAIHLNCRCTYNGTQVGYYSGDHLVNDIYLTKLMNTIRLIN